MQWRSSSHSQNGGQCLQVPVQPPAGGMYVRDSKDTSRTPIVVSRAAWSSFVTAVAETSGNLSS
ncbi:DUF397 domain-containing protein [Streptomyces mashuensis]|nr:DUF397 domain-containing protein [Streptomyces mashuensis]